MVEVEVVNSNLVPDGHTYQISFRTPSPDSLRATTYTLFDSTLSKAEFLRGQDLEGNRAGPVGAGLLPVIDTPIKVAVDTTATGFVAGSPTDALLTTAYLEVLPINLVRPGFPDDITVTFYDEVVDTTLSVYPIDPAPAKFRAVAHGVEGDLDLDSRFRDLDSNGTLSSFEEYIDIITYAASAPAAPMVTWRLRIDTTGSGGEAPVRPPAAGDVYEIRLIRPFGADDVFSFSTDAEFVGEGGEDDGFDPYVVPNPYVGSASFEPERYAISGRGERRIEFRGLPRDCTVRIYTVLGDLVQTIRQDGSDDGFVAWDLRTKDNLDVAPGLYIYQVDAGRRGTSIGKFAILK
jgi:hypothetical protein